MHPPPEYASLIRFLQTPGPRSDWTPAVVAVMYQLDPSQTPSIRGAWTGVLTVTELTEADAEGFLDEQQEMAGRLLLDGTLAPTTAWSSRAPLTVSLGLGWRYLPPHNLTSPGRTTRWGQWVSLRADAQIGPEWTTSNPLPTLVDKGPRPKEELGVISGPVELPSTTMRFPSTLSPGYVHL